MNEPINNLDFLVVTCEEEKLNEQGNKDFEPRGQWNVNSKRKKHI